MRSVMFVFLILVLAMGIAMAGGIVTNTNQSAAYMRTLNRNASTDVDAVYFNPAGLTRLEDGLHLSLSNQSIFQTKTVTNNYQFLNTDEFVGDVKAPLFPNFYLAYKTGKLALSAGFEPIGGGGSANYEKGLPSFELPVSDLVPGLADQGVTAYDIDVAFEGSSIYYGFQAGISYKVNDMVSIGLGGRYVSASNLYVGHLKDIAITLGGSPLPATTFFTGAAAQYTNAATGATSAVTGLNAAVTAGQVLTSTPLAAMDADSSLINGLIAFGLDPTGYTVGNAIAAYTGAATSAGTSAAEMTAKSTLLADQEVDVTQKATGITPIISVLLTPFDGLDISFRYEGLTALELVNEADADKQALVGFDETTGAKIYQFPDGEKTNADMPAMMAVGVAYKVMPALRAEFNLNYYLNSGVNWDGREEDIENGYDVGVAVEYCVNDKLKASVGFSNSDGGANPAYQTDLSYDLKSNTIGLGIAYAVSPNLIVNVGGLNTFFQEDEKSSTHLLGTTAIPVVEKYMKTTFGFAIGVDYKF
ncbi:MAG: hypothetical protein ISS29_09720 [Candidatus Marinimicrobia bacterium]|nr:hypothetical protein [Candidatus Neomarinimicrobiota bacterium]